MWSKIIVLLLVNVFVAQSRNIKSDLETVRDTVDNSEVYDVVNEQVCNTIVNECLYQRP